MKIALYYRHIEPTAEPSLDELVSTLHAKGIDTCELHNQGEADGCDFLFSIGGDGTLLSSVQFVDAEHPELFPPVLGINFGHLGFLTTVGRENLHGMAECLLNGQYTLEKRTLLQLSTPHAPHSDQYALNEVFLHRSEESSLLRTEVEVDRRHVATYAGDGLIVATPTGSTAYSLSCGGPILTPDSRCFAITPVAAHTLTLRPIVVHDSAELHLRTVPSQHHTGQPSAGGFTLGIDSRRFAFECGTALPLRRAPFTISLVRLGGQDFFSAMRDKLMWGY